MSTAPIAHRVPAAHLAMLADLKQLIAAHPLTILEQLAILSRQLGAMIAETDSEVLPVDLAMQIIGRNIEVGNQIAIARLVAAPIGGSMSSAAPLDAPQ